MQNHHIDLVLEVVLVGLIGGVASSQIIEAVGKIF